MALKDITITGSIGSYPTLSYGQKTYVSSTDEESFPIEHFTGSAGGTTPNFNGQFATTDLFVNITQSWNGSIDTQVGIVDFTHNTQEEFINGEYSGSGIEVTHQRLIDEHCIQFLNVSTVPVNYKPFFYVADVSSPSYSTILNNFYNRNTSPNLGEIYLFSVDSFFLPSKKVYNIKINRFDDLGNDNTLSLQELTSLRIQFSDLGIVDFPLLTITEYPTYYLYSTYVSLPGGAVNSADNNVLDYQFSASVSTFNIPYSSFWSGSGLVSSIDARSYFNLTEENYLFGDTPNIPIQFTASLDLGSTMLGSFEFRNKTTNSTIAFFNPFISTAGIYTISGSFYPLENNTYELRVINGEINPGTYTINNIQWQFTQSIAPSSSTNLTVLSPYLLENFEYSDCNVLINNATNLEYDPNFYKVNYDTGLLIPTNQQEILDGTAELAPVKPYNYSLNAQVLPRYNGTKITAPDFNTSSNNEVGIVAGNPKPFVGYYGSKGGSTPEVIGKTIINLDYIIDESINAEVPALSDFTYGNQIQLFERGKYLYLDPNGASAQLQFAGNNKYKIYRSGEYATPILYSQTGSNPLYIDSLSFINPDIPSIDDYYNSSTFVATSGQYATFYLYLYVGFYSSLGIDTNNLYFPLLLNPLTTTLPPISGYIQTSIASYTHTFPGDTPRVYNDIYEYEYISAPPVFSNISFINKARFKIKVRNVTGTGAFPNVNLLAMPITLTISIYNRPPASLNYNILQDTQYDIAEQTFTINAGDTKEFDLESSFFIPTNGNIIGIKAKTNISYADFINNTGLIGKYFQTQNGSLEIIQDPSPNSLDISINDGNYILGAADSMYNNTPISFIQFTSSFNNAYGSIYPQISGSGYDSTIYPFELSPDSPEITTQPEYEIRFIADESLTFPILSVYRDPSSGLFALMVSRLEQQLLATLPQETLNSFLIRRWIPRAGYIYLDVDASLGAGIVKPEFITDGIQAKIPEIIKNLTDKGLITQN